MMQVIINEHRELNRKNQLRLQHSVCSFDQASFNFNSIDQLIIKADLALQVGTDLVKIDLSEETTNILHAVTMIRILMKTT